MAVSLTTITNVSKQVIPVLVNSISLDKASVNSDVAPEVAQQMSIAPGSAVTLESRRLDSAQLDQLRRKRLITFAVA